MPGTYTHTTFQSLVDQLAQELNDSGKVFFTDTELQLNLYETFRVWNMLTGWNREQASFSSQPGVAFYSLESVLPSQIAKTVTVRDVVGPLQFRLMEPYDPIASSGVSEMYSHSSLVRSIQQRQNRFLAETAQEFTQKLPIVVAAGDGKVELDDTTVSIVRAVWMDQNGCYFNVTVPGDESTAAAFIPSWRQSPGVPRSMSISFQPNLTLQLIPPPIDTGELHLFTIEAGSNLDTTFNTVLSVMDDSSWGLVWGAAEDLLLRDGIGHDPDRAQFCNKMYSLCVEMTKSLPTVLGTLINGVAVEPTSLNMLDSMRSGWEGQNYAKPKTVSVMGNWLALQPVPDDTYEIGVHLVRKSPLPALGDQVQLGREQLAAIIAWAKQICLFKKQGVQLQQGMQAAGALVQQARTYNEDRIFRSTYLCEIYGISPERTWNPPREAQAQPVDTDPRVVADEKSARGGSAGYKRPFRRLGGR